MNNERESVCRFPVSTYFDACAAVAGDVAPRRCFPTEAEPSKPPSLLEGYTYSDRVAQEQFAPGEELAYRLSIQVLSCAVVMDVSALGATAGACTARVNEQRDPADIWRMFPSSEPLFGAYDGENDYGINRKLASGVRSSNQQVASIANPFAIKTSRNAVVGRYRTRRAAEEALWDAEERTGLPYRIDS